MDVRTYERYKRQIESKRKKAIETAEADYRRELESLDVLWRLDHAVEDRPHVATPSTPSTVAPQPTKTRTTGVKKAILVAVLELGDEFNTDAIFEKVRVTYPDVKRQTVTDALFRMAEGEDGELETVTPGKGRRQAVYRIRRRIQDTQAETIENEAIRPSEALPM